MRERLQSYSHGMCLLVTLAAAATAQAQTFNTLYAFTGGADGGSPWGPPLLYNGFILGTTYYGGSPSSGQVGTVFEYLPYANTVYPYYTFTGQPTDGAYPMGGLVSDGLGNFFGTTTQGGLNLDGTIYEISGGSESVLDNFSEKDGIAPEGNLLLASDGNLFGTTPKGGANGLGTVFVVKAGSFVRLHSFGNAGNDGIAPAADLALLNGVLYGTTTAGGKYRWGTVFSLDVKTRAETVLYAFKGKEDGGAPAGGLVTDGLGNLYGTAASGGSVTGTAGSGVVFELNIKTKTYTVLHTFMGSDGADPTGALVTDGRGNFFGTTFAGGANGYGTVFEINSAGTFTTLYSFINGTDGAYPYGGVTLDSSGNLYGTATRGGQDDWGTLFEITAAP